MLIVAFIFLTPKTWFDKRERLATSVQRLVVQKVDYSADRRVLETRVRELIGNPQAEIVDVQEKINGLGQTIYEIEIR
ncbi:MAG: hypothetical protein LC730_00315 [Acidobacteria bacterium]|nr:hypothetical protein [Acidobacteriota bacterium]